MINPIIVSVIYITVAVYLLMKSGIIRDINYGFTKIMTAIFWPIVIPIYLSYLALCVIHNTMCQTFSKD